MRWIGLVCPSHPGNAWLNCDLGNLEAKPRPQTHCCVPQIIPEPFLLWGRVQYPAERGRSHQAAPFTWKCVYVCNKVVRVKVTSTWMVPNICCPLSLRCFAFAELPWYQRKVAAVIFSSPPESTYEEVRTAQSESDILCFLTSCTVSFVFLSFRLWRSS